jgi:hypothetical protein
MPSDSCTYKASPEISRSTIYVDGGFLLLPNLFPPEDLNKLEAEAKRARPRGQRNVWSLPGGADERGGNPDRAFSTGPGAETQYNLLAAPDLVARLAQACGLELAITGGGSYSYYEESGDFLGLHRDIVSCELTVVTCVRSDGAEPDAGMLGAGMLGSGMLLVYSNHMNAPLARARGAGKAEATRVPISRGESVALLGGFVPHEVTPMLPSQERIVSVMCYRIG